MAGGENIREATSDDIRIVETFLTRNLVIHRHLDWRPPIEWIGKSPFLMLEKGTSIQGLLVCPPDPEHVYWIRILASLFSIPIANAYQNLFPVALEKIRSSDPNSAITSIAYLEWMKSLLMKNGWEICQQVVQLRWNRSKSATKSHISTDSHLIRPMTMLDIPRVAVIDHTCFDFLWQHSEDAIRRAFEQSTYCTVAEKDGILIGYQVTTLQRGRVHIARLAVLPEFQGQYIGQHLVEDVIRQNRKPWTREISVNTQKDNFKSLGLYKKIGFELTDENFPIFIYNK